MSTIATMTIQSHDCGQDKGICVCRIVLHHVQGHVPFHCHDSERCLRAACIIMCWNDTHAHTHMYPTCDCIRIHSHMTEDFQCRLLMRTQPTYM